MVRMAADDSFQSFRDYIRIQKESFWLMNDHMAENERRSLWHERLTSIMLLTDMPFELPNSPTQQQPSPCKRRSNSTSLHTRASKRPMLDDTPHAINLYRNASAPSTHVEAQAPRMMRGHTDGAVQGSRRAAHAPNNTFGSAIDNIRSYSVEDYVMSTIAEEPCLSETLALPAIFHVDISDSRQQASPPYGLPYDLEQHHQTYLDTPSIDANSSMTRASTMTSEPMSRANTNDMICGPMDMLRVRSIDPKQAHIDNNVSQTHDVTFFSPSSFPPTNTVSQQYTHVFAPHLPVFSTNPSFETSSPSSSFMTHSISQSSSPLLSSSPSNKSRALRRTEEQNAHSARPIAPKSNDAINPLLAPTLKRVPLENGGMKEVAQIPKSNYSRPSKQKTFCHLCNDQPEGFHGDHELRRHIDRIHATKRKVWICKEAQAGGNFLANCKACRNKKTYGANYNAAAHLRRTHFHPCKKGRGGRGKPSEKRGGKGGGDHPSMAELKDWMYETEEVVPADDLYTSEDRDDDLTLASPFSDEVTTNGPSQTSSDPSDDDAHDSLNFDMFDHVDMMPASYMLAASGTTNKTHNSVGVSCSTEANSIPRQPLMQIMSTEQYFNGAFPTTIDTNSMYDTTFSYNSYGAYTYPAELDVEVGGST